MKTSLLVCIITFKMLFIIKQFQNYLPRQSANLITTLKFSSHLGAIVMQLLRNLLALEQIHVICQLFQKTKLYRSDLVHCSNSSCPQVNLIYLIFQSQTLIASCQTIIIKMNLQLDMNDCFHSFTSGKIYSGYRRYTYLASQSLKVGKGDWITVQD